MASWVHTKINPGLTLPYSFNKWVRGFYTLEITVHAGDSSSGIKAITFLMENTSQLRKEKKRETGKCMMYQKKTERGLRAVEGRTTA